MRCRKTYGAGVAGNAKGKSHHDRGGGEACIVDSIAVATTGRSRRRRRPIHDRDDHHLEGKADYGEVNELYEDMGLSIEELRRKYYGGGGGAGEEEGKGEEEEDGKMRAADASASSGTGTYAASKRMRRMDDSDDDECGF